MIVDKLACLPVLLALLILPATDAQTVNITSLADNIKVTFTPETGIVTRLGQTSVSIIIDLSNVTSTNNGTTGLSLSDIRLTLNMTSADVQTAYTDESPVIKYDLDAGTINSTVVIYGGANVGNTIISILARLEIEGATLLEDSEEYDVTVVREDNKTSTQTILDYITMIFGLLILFLVASDANVASLKNSTTWIFGTLLIQAVLVPVGVLIYVSLLRVPPPTRLGIMTTSFTPGVLVALAFGVLLEVDLTLLTVLVLTSFIAAFGVMPLWSLQFAHSRVASDLVLSPSDIPYVTLFIVLLVCLLVLVAGLVVRNYFTYLANNIKKFTYPVSVLFCVYSVLAALVGGFDLLPSVHVRGGISCFLWTGTLTIIIIFGMLSPGPNGCRWRACGVFLLLKESTLSYGTLITALDHPARDYAMVGAFFLALMTKVMAVLIVMVYLIRKCLRKNTGEGGSDDVVEIEIEPDEPVVQERARYRRLPTEDLNDANQRAELMGNAAMKMGAFGAPSLFVWI